MPEQCVGAFEIRESVAVLEAASSSHPTICLFIYCLKLQTSSPSCHWSNKRIRPVTPY